MLGFHKLGEPQLPLTGCCSARQPWTLSERTTSVPSTPQEPPISPASLLPASTPVPASAPPPRRHPGRCHSHEPLAVPSAALRGGPSCPHVLTAELDGSGALSSHPDQWQKRAF